MLKGFNRISSEGFQSYPGGKLCLKRPIKAIKPTMNHFSFFVNLLVVGWSVGRVVSDAHAAVSSCSLDMASLSLVTV